MEYVIRKVIACLVVFSFVVSNTVYAFAPTETITHAKSTLRPLAALNADIGQEINVPIIKGLVEQTMTAFNEEGKEGIEFGTSGFRGKKSLNELTVAITAQATVDYIESIGLSDKIFAVCKDTRDKGDIFVKITAAVFAANGIKVVVSDGYTPTPVIAHATVYNGYGGAVNFTASHNPKEYKGYKFTPEHGGAATAKATNIIEKKAKAYLERLKSIKGIKGDLGSIYLKVALYYEKMLETFYDSEDIEFIEPMEDYIKYLFNLEMQGEKIFDKVGDSHLMVAASGLHGTAGPYFERIFGARGLNKLARKVLNKEPRKDFGSFNAPMPNEKNLQDLKGVVSSYGNTLGVSADGDGDREGIVDTNGIFMTANELSAIFYWYLHEIKGLKGGVAKTVATTNLLNALAGKFNEKCYEKQVGFKNFKDEMLRGDVLVAAESSAHVAINAVSWDDGFLCGLLSYQILSDREGIKAKTGTEFNNLTDILHYIESRVVENHFSFYEGNIPADDSTKKLLLSWNENPGLLTEQLGKAEFLPILESSNLEVDRISTLPKKGVKVVFKDGSWLCLRPSGTEPLVRLYTEAVDKSIDILPKKKEALNKLAEKLLQSKKGDDLLNKASSAGMFKGVVFDLDGVITSTAKIHFSAWKNMFEEEFNKYPETKGRVFTEDDYLVHVDGTPRYDGCKAMLNAVGLKEFECVTAIKHYVDKEKHAEKYVDLTEQQQRAMDMIKELGDEKNTQFAEYLEEHSEDVEVLPGIEQLLSDLLKKGIKLAVASSSKNTPRVLELIGLSDTFEVIISGHDIGNYSDKLHKKIEGKPNPDVFLEAVLRMGLKPGECVGFEDAVKGVTAIKAAGMPCVGVDSKNKGLLGEADVVIPNLIDMNFRIMSNLVNGKASSAGMRKPDRIAVEAVLREIGVERTLQLLTEASELTPIAADLATHNPFARIGFAAGLNRMMLGWVPERINKFLDDEQSYLVSKVTYIAYDLEASGKKNFIFTGIGGSGLGVGTIVDTYGQPKDGKIYTLTTPSRDQQYAVIEDLKARYNGDFKKALEESTLFAISKSGSTAETREQMEFFESLYAQYGLDPKEHIMLITDPDITDKAVTGKGANPFTIRIKSGYKWVPIQLDDEFDIGGRFTSPTTMISLLPLALINPMFVTEYLQEAYDMVRIQDADDLISREPFIALGVFLDIMSKIKSPWPYNKLTLLLPKELKAFAPWLVQLIHESLGKDGKGIELLFGEELTPEMANDFHRQKRIFLRVNIAGQVETEQELWSAINQADVPTFEIMVKGKESLGGLQAGSQITTAVFASRSEIPFVIQPAVEKHKKATNNVMGTIKNGEALKLPEIEDNIISDWVDNIIGSKSGKFSLYFYPLIEAGILTLDQIRAEVRKLGADMNDPSAVYAAIFNLIEKLPRFEQVQFGLFGTMSDKTKEAFARIRKETFTDKGIPSLIATWPDDLHANEQDMADGLGREITFTTAVYPTKAAEIPGGEAVNIKMQNQLAAPFIGLMNSRIETKGMICGIAYEGTQDEASVVLERFFETVNTLRAATKASSAGISLSVEEIVRIDLAAEIANISDARGTIVYNDTALSLKQQQMLQRLIGTGTQGLAELEAKLGCNVKLMTQGSGNIVDNANVIIISNERLSDFKNAKYFIIEQTQINTSYVAIAPFIAIAKGLLGLESRTEQPELYAALKSSIRNLSQGLLNEKQIETAITAYINGNPMFIKLPLPVSYDYDQLEQLQRQAIMRLINA